MLTADLLVASQRRGQVRPRYLPTEGPGAQAALARAAALIDLFAAHRGCSRGALNEAIDDLVAGRPDLKVDRGLAKLLEDRSTFRGLPSQEAAALRREVFVRAAQARAAGRFDRDALLAEVAAEQERPARLLDDLYGDLKENEVLEETRPLAPVELLQRYAVGLAQAVLLRALELEVVVRAAAPPRLRQLLRHVRFQGLLQEARRDEAGAVRLRLDGPLSIFSATPRYGVRMAGFLPALLLCEDWQLRAQVQLGKGRHRREFLLTPADGLISHAPDTGAWLPALVEAFAARFAEVVDDWTVDREVDLLNLGGQVVVPDFRFVHRASGWTGHMEVLGYWRRGAIRKRLELLRQHPDTPLLLALDQALKLGREGAQGLGAAAVPFRELPSARTVKKALETLRTRAAD